MKIMVEQVDPMKNKLFCRPTRILAALTWKPRPVAVALNGYPKLRPQVRPRAIG